MLIQTKGFGRRQGVRAWWVQRKTFSTSTTNIVLAGHRWHIDCFRCNTCRTLLDSDANLLLLGDGSLICNNCTYSCSACGQKIEDLAILTGDQAYCAACFKCRNCKKQIENLRYARTSQGMFCMECHDALMARRRKRTARSTRKTSHNAAHLDKSLPSLPPNAYGQPSLSPDDETPQSGTFSNSDTPTELPGSVPPSMPPSRLNSSRSDHRDRSPANSERGPRGQLLLFIRFQHVLINIGNLTLPSTSYRRDRASGGMAPFDGTSDDYIPMTLDPNVVQGPSPMLEPRVHQTNGKSSGSAREHENTGTDYFNIKEKSSRRKAPREPKAEEPSLEQTRNDLHPTSPHIAYQEKGFEPSSDNIDALRRRKVSEAGIPTRDPRRDRSPQVNRTQIDQEKFRLQDAPKRRKSSARGEPKDEHWAPSVDTAVLDPKSKSAPASAHTPLKEQHVNIAGHDSTRSSQLETPTQLSPRMSQDSRSGENAPVSGLDVQTLPKRGDSLQKSAQSISSIHRKDVPNSKIASISSYDTSLESSPPHHPSSARSPESSSANMNGGRVIGRPMESPVAKSALDFPSTSIDQGEDSIPDDSFASPRAAPPRPGPETLKHKFQNASISSVRSDSVKNGDFPSSPSLSRFPASNDYVTDDTIRSTGEDQDGFFNSFKRVSKSVRHARSQSDRGSRNSREQKWPKTQLNGAGTTADRDLSSPTISSPESKNEIMLLKQELSQSRHENKLERQKVMELRGRIAELESTMDKKVAINAVNSELREKRSTMVVLDAQKEIVINELEVITEHLQDAKRSGKPLDLPDMQNKVLKDFATALERVRDSYAPQIEERIQMRNDLNDELGQLNQQKDKVLREFEQLSLKNAQLAELNNTLVRQIQELHVKLSDKTPTQHHGLGIYTHHAKERSNASIDSREVASVADSHLTGTTITEQGPDSATIVNAPQVVNIQKMPAGKKLNFLGGKRGAMAKGLKAAFSSNENKQIPRDGSISGLTEGMPYGHMSQSGDLPVTTLPARNVEVESSRQGFGFFGQPKSKTGQSKMPPRSETPTKAPVDASSKLITAGIRTSLVNHV